MNEEEMTKREFIEMRRRHRQEAITDERIALWTTVVLTMCTIATIAYLFSAGAM